MGVPGVSGQQGPGKVGWWGLDDLRFRVAVTGVACVTGVVRRTSMEVLTQAVESRTTPVDVIFSYRVCNRVHHAAGASFGASGAGARSA